MTDVIHIYTEGLERFHIGQQVTLAPHRAELEWNGVYVITGIQARVELSWMEHRETVGLQLTCENGILGGIPAQDVRPIQPAGNC